MNCKQIQREMDAAFDAGVAMNTTAANHARTCPDCAAHQRTLDNLDGTLRAVPPVLPAPALVARIQDRIAAEPVRQPRPWVYPLATAAAVLLLAALGRIAHTMFPTAGWVRQAWLRFALEGLDHVLHGDLRRHLALQVSAHAVGDHHEQCIAGI